MEHHVMLVLTSPPPAHIDGFFVYRGEELPAEGDEIHVEHTLGVFECEAYVTHVEADAQFPIGATQIP